MRVRTVKSLLFGLVAIVATVLTIVMIWDFAPDYMDYIQGFNRVSVGHAHYITDLSDDRKLMGASDNVFFGQVIEKLGQTEKYGAPESQFRVKVLYVFKGSVTGDVTVNQEGGRWKIDNSTYRMEGVPRLFEPGKSYLFATRFNSMEDWHTVAPNYGDVEIKVSDYAADSEVLNSVHAIELKSRFSDAVVNEIRYTPGRRSLGPGMEEEDAENGSTVVNETP